MSEAGHVRSFVAVGLPPQPGQYKKGGGDYDWPENTCPVSNGQSLLGFNQLLPFRM